MMLKQLIKILDVNIHGLSFIHFYPSIVPLYPSIFYDVETTHKNFRYKYLWS